MRCDERMSEEERRDWGQRMRETEGRGKDDRRVEMRRCEDRCCKMREETGNERER